MNNKSWLIAVVIIVIIAVLWLVGMTPMPILY